VNPEFQRDKDGVVFKADRDIAAGLPGMAAKPRSGESP